MRRSMSTRSNFDRGKSYTKHNWNFTQTDRREIFILYTCMKEIDWIAWKEYWIVYDETDERVDK